MKFDLTRSSILALLSLTLCLASCKTTPAPCRISAKADQTVSPSSDLGMAVLWFERAAEARALYYQAYNIAQERLDAALSQRKPDEKLAVVMDIDETILDNSALEANLIETGKTYSTNLWWQWVSQSRAIALPGSLSFLRYAASNNVAVFYVTNRKTNEFEPTMRNLKAQGFPMVDTEHLLMQISHEGKEPNRQNIRGRYKIVLLMGDNLGDFTQIYDNISSDQRSRLVDVNREQFGRLFIVLPNPMYGSWETSLYPPGLTAEEKAAFRQKLLKKISADAP